MLDGGERMPSKLDAMGCPPGRTVTYVTPMKEYAELKFPSDFPNPSSLRLLKHLSWGNGGPFQCLLDYAGARYNFLLVFDENESKSKVNTCLQRIHQGLVQRDYGVMDEGVSDCFDIILPVLKSDYERRVKSGLHKKEEEVVKILIKYLNDSLCVAHHDMELNYNSDDECGKPVENPFPHLRVLADFEVERLEELGGKKCKVGIDGKEYFLKTAYGTDPDSFLREFTILAKLSYHPNLVSLFGVTDAGGGKIDGLVMPFIRGTLLKEIKSATEAQRVKWKKHISEAVHFLHSLNIVWGDAAVQNVMIDRVNDRAILFDFGGGITRGWIEDSLYETNEGDLQALGRLHTYIDSLRENEAAK